VHKLNQSLSASNAELERINRSLQREILERRNVEDRLRHAALDRRQVRQQRPDGDQDPDVSPGLGSRLLLGHPARLPVSIVKSVVV